MRIYNSKKYNYIFAAIGCISGFGFVALTLAIDLYLHQYTFSITNILKIHELHSIYYFIDFSPIPFTIASYFIGIYINKGVKSLRTDIENETERSKRIFAFTEKMRTGQIDADLELFDKNDELGISLINLRNELKKSKEDDAVRKREDSQRQWITEGLAKFGEILRENNNNLEKLSFEVISNLVKYIDAKVAGFFILNENDPENRYFDMSASFAYGRRKFADKKVNWGEGLIGACALEKQTIFIKEVSDRYVEITSGLGKANPRCLLVVPLKTDDEIHGVIELASFKIYEPYEIEFIEKIAESTASTISSAKINMRTAQLLKESQEQAQIMAKQEEDMRRSMDELKMTQIEAAKQAEQFISFTNSVNHTMIRAEYSVDGTLLYANTKFLQKLGYKSNSEVEGKHIQMFINKKDREWFDKLWDGLAAGGKHFEGDMKHVTKQGMDLWTMATYVCVRDHQHKPIKILFLGIDVTEAKKQSLDYKGQIDAVNRSSLKAEYLPDGRILEYNDKFLSILGYNNEEIIDKSLFEYLTIDEVDEFRNIWENVVNGNPYEGRQKRYSKTGEEHWLHGTYTVVHDMYNEPAKIVYIGTDITEQIRIETKNKEQTETLKDQEEKLQQSKIELSRKLKETREEMKLQFREIETVKMLNEKTLEGMQDAVVTINQDNIVEFFNKAAEELWGIQRAEVINKDVAIIMPTDIDENDNKYMGNFFKYMQNNPLLNSRAEVYIIDKYSEKANVLLTLSEARIGTRYSLTAFIQRIEVELF